MGVRGVDMRPAGGRGSTFAACNVYGFCEIKIKILVKLCGYLARAEGAQVDLQITKARTEVIVVGVYGGNLSNSMIPWTWAYI
jgi:hypothetical protein